MPKPLQFDVTDPKFTTEILSLAPSCPLLLYSMLATASIHKSRFTVDPGTSNKLAAEADIFHEKCVNMLLPMLHDPSSITDGAFLACSTILRFYEEISGTKLKSLLQLCSKVTDGETINSPCASQGRCQAFAWRLCICGSLSSSRSAPAMGRPQSSIILGPPAAGCLQRAY